MRKNLSLINTSTLSSRLRVQQTLAHQQPDGIPFSWGLRPTPEMAERLDDYLRERGMSWHGLSLATEDTLPISPRYIGPPLPPRTDMWGIVRKQVSYGDGTYDEIEYYPLAEINTPGEIDKYAWPDPEWFDYANLRRDVLTADPHGRLAGKLWIDVCGNPFEIYTWMTGHERTFSNLILNPDVVHTSMEHITQFFEEKLRRTLPLVTDRVDICYFADDLGGQQGLLMSPGSYRQMIMPYHQRLFRLAKELGQPASRAKAGGGSVEEISPSPLTGGPAIMLHSDGSVFDLLPDLIEAGVEVLEAVQVDAAKMDAQMLKDTYGERLAFHGGISVQSLLPHEKDITVETTCRYLVRVLGAGGGYIAAPTHCIQAGTPPENVMAMLRGILGAQDADLAMQSARLEIFKLALDNEGTSLQLPVKSGAEKVIFVLEAAGEAVYEFEIELALGQAPDWWASLSLQGLLDQLEIEDRSNLLLRTKTASIPHGVSEWLNEFVRQGEGIFWAEDLYNERLRPQLHFTPRRGWNNDPNGLVYRDGTWHMFFQHNPYGTAWGNMHWGHAVSKDLMGWEEMPIALYQRSLTDMAFSGSGAAGVSSKDTNKLLAENQLALFFTSTGRGECMAVSKDEGKTFREYGGRGSGSQPGNPLITHQGRDPKVIWYVNPDLENPQEDGHWVMVVYEELVPNPTKADELGYAIYVSNDLVTWRRTDFLPGFWECPELFEMAVDDRRVWVLYGAVWQGMRSVFVMGEFDGECFSPISDPIQAHLGPNFYAAQTFSNAPDERRIMLGWLAGADYPGMPFSQGMTVPLELSLRSAGEGSGGPLSRAMSCLRAGSRL